MAKRKFRLSKSGGRARCARLETVRPAEKMYAGVSWQWEDIKSKRPSWSEQKCRNWLQSNQNRLRDRMVEEGWAAIETMLEDE